MSRRLALAICMVAWPGGGVLAQTGIGQDIARCAAIVGNMERLDCYDRVARSSGVTAPQSRPSVSGPPNGWVVQDQIDPFDGTRSVTLARTASNSGRFGVPIMLVLRCRGGEMDAYIDWKKTLGAGNAWVATRIDSGPVQGQHWGLSTNNTATFFPGDDVEFFWTLMPARELKAQVTPTGGNAVTAIFDLTGLSDAAVPLRDACRLFGTS